MQAIFLGICIVNFAFQTNLYSASASKIVWFMMVEREEWTEGFTG